ncbi:Oidioi.mRNA.OKI2018_I69.XSR.g14426.t1.cds [Oikopleura dioica]|uniref:Oidioi.mRNA.OKI2018_I69.XSR.g14426.t1.cds n=1 Tax=Oikopleura dioica TaxID=34765 RepID=A0ABN7S9S0_OIKDI|nr:Oidioi.mRNA.OKI2018_I69.XSR.g14426.t1.cds [Oikopleura dioica]
MSPVSLEFQGEFTSEERSAWQNRFREMMSEITVDRPRSSTSKFSTLNTPDQPSPVQKQCKIVLHKTDSNANEIATGSLSPQKKNSVDGVASYMVPVSGDSNENDIRCIRDIVERFHSTGGEISWASYRSLPRVKPMRANTADSASMCSHVIAEHLDLVNKFIGHQKFLKYIMIENQRYKTSCYIQPHIAQCIFKYTDYFIQAYSENSMKVCGIINLPFPSNVEEFFRIQEDFFSDHFVDVSSKYADSGYEIREHAKLLDKERLSKDMNCPKYRFWTDIFEYGKENAEYFLERQTFADLFAERNQKFIQMKNVCERLYSTYEKYDSGKFTRAMRFINVQVKAIENKLKEKQQQYRHFEFYATVQDFPPLEAHRAGVGFIFEARALPLEKVETEILYPSEPTSTPIEEDVMGHLSHEELYNTTDKLRLAFYDEFMIICKKERSKHYRTLQRKRSGRSWKFCELIPYYHITKIIQDVKASPHFAVVCEGGGRRLLLEYQSSSEYKSFDDFVKGFFDVVEKRLKEVDGIVEFSKIEMGLRGTKRIVPFFRTSGGRANIAPELALLQSRVQIQYVETVNKWDMRVSPFIGRRSDHMRRSKKREGSSGELTLPKYDLIRPHAYKPWTSTFKLSDSLTHISPTKMGFPRSQTCFSMYEGLMRTTSMRSVSSLNSYRSHLNNSANNLDECNESPNILEHASGDDVFLSHNVEKLVI